jgi:hypothetical protein
VEKSATIYLQRAEAKAERDSGWYVAPAERPKPGSMDEIAAAEPPPINAMLVSDFLAVRPDLRDALSLPSGYLVVVAPSEVLAVLDPQDRDVWELKEMTGRGRSMDEMVGE